MQRPNVVPLDIEKIEDVKVCRDLFCATLDLFLVAQMKSLLKQAKNGLSMFVETDDFAINQRRLGNTCLKGARDFGKPKCVVVSVTAEELHLVTIETAEDTLAIEFRLENPVRIIERIGNQSTEHRRHESGKRTRFERAQRALFSHERT